MIQSSIARRYARALLESAGAEFEQAGTELAALASSMADQPELGLLFADPSASREARRGVLEAIIARAGLHPMVANLLRLLDDRNRVPDLPTIAAVYAELVDETVGRLRAHITSAEPLPSEMTERLRVALSEATHKQVEVESSQDRSLLGGVVAQVGNVVYDGSLRTQLDRMRRELTGQA